jgi:D-alanine-D-alanine ligase
MKASTMSAENRIVILHGQVAAEARADEQDVLEEVRQVSEVLTALGYETMPVILSLDLDEAARRLREISPLLVFNLVESIDGRDRLLHLAASFLEFLGIPYTGTGSVGMYLASNKLLAKRLLLQAGIPTPPWAEVEEALTAGPDFEGPYLVKSVWDNASLGLEQIFEDRRGLREYLAGPTETVLPADRFVERYIEGREFNISILQSGRCAQVLPVAEMLFADYPPGKPRIVDYAAKWDPESFEFSHTVRRFDFGREDEGLLAELTGLARACWVELGMEGYARVDVRVDDRGYPWVLEVNPNPGISMDAGLAAAASRAGLSYRDLVQGILQPVLERVDAGSSSKGAGPPCCPAQRVSRS